MIVLFGAILVVVSGLLYNLGWYLGRDRGADEGRVEGYYNGRKTEREDWQQFLAYKTDHAEFYLDADGNEVPMPVRAWDEALEDGWEPAGPSMTVPTENMIVTFAMVKRPLRRLILAGFETVQEVQ